MFTSEERTAASRSSETKASSIHSAPTDESDATRSSLSVPIPDNEHERLEALYRYGILDTPPELPFDRLTRRAAELLAAPAAVISFIDRDRQWGRVAMDFPFVNSRQPGKSHYVPQTIPGDEPAVACDARKDDRFRSNTFVTGEPHIRFYVGVPLTSAEGFRLGSLCVFGPEPRPSPDPGKMEALQQIASEVMEQLEASKARNQLNQLNQVASTRAGA